MEMNFCRRCGKPLTHLERHIFRCRLGHVLYANCSPAVSTCLITDNGAVLLIVRGIEPNKGMLDTPGGFLDGEEPFEDAAIRELHEEVALQAGDYEALTYLVSALGPYPYKGEILPVITVQFWARLKTASISKIKPGDDADAVRLIPLNDIPLDQLHNDDIRIGILRLQSMFANKKGEKYADITN